MGMLIRLELCDVPPQAKSVPLGHKRKRGGHPAEAKKALINTIILNVRVHVLGSKLSFARNSVFSFPRCLLFFWAVRHFSFLTVYHYLLTVGLFFSRCSSFCFLLFDIFFPTVDYLIHLLGSVPSCCEFLSLL